MGSGIFGAINYRSRKYPGVLYLVRQPRDAEPEVTVEREQDKLDYPELRRWFVR